MTALSRADMPGPEASIGKIVSAGKLQDIASFALDLMDMGGAILDPELAPMRAALQKALLYSRGGRIRRRHRRDPETHHRRASAGTPRRHPRRQGHGVQERADGSGNRQALELSATGQGAGSTSTSQVL